MKRNRITSKFLLLFCSLSFCSQISAQVYLVNYDYPWTGPDAYVHSNFYSIQWSAFPEFHLPSRFMGGYAMAWANSLDWDAPLKHGFTHSKTWLNDLEYKYSIGQAPYSSLGSPVASRMDDYAEVMKCNIPEAPFEMYYNPTARQNAIDRFRYFYETGDENASTWMNGCPALTPPGVQTPANDDMPYQNVGATIQQNVGLALYDFEQSLVIQHYWGPAGFDNWLDCVKDPGAASWCDGLFPDAAAIGAAPSRHRIGMPASSTSMSHWDFKKAWMRTQILTNTLPIIAYKSVPAASRAPIGNFDGSIVDDRIFYDRPSVTWNEMLTDPTCLALQARDTVNFTQFGNCYTDGLDYYAPTCGYTWSGSLNDYSIYGGEWLWKLLYSVEVHKHWDPTKPVYPYIWLKYDYNSGTPNYGIFKDPSFCEAYPIFTIMSGGDGWLVWDGGNSISNEHVHDKFVKGMHRLARFNHIIDSPDSYYSNMNPLQVRDMGTANNTNSGVIRAMIKGDSILVAAINPYATNASQITTIPINYNDGHYFLDDVITLVGRETFLGIAKLNIILPINVTSFDAQYKSLNNTVKATWLMSDEEGVVKYEVERSGDKSNFISLGTQNMDEAAGGQYTFTDYSPIERAYYRVKITDLEGKTTYTDVVEVNINASVAFELMPNPGTNELKIEWTDESPRIIKVFNPMGQLVQLEEVSEENGLRFNTETWVSGTYLVVVETESGESVSKRWIKL